MINMTVRQILARAHDQTHLVGHVPDIQSYSLLTSLLVTFIARTHHAGTQKGPQTIMATTITCDRCGTKIIPRDDGYEQTKILFMPAAEDDLPEYDLCPPCDQEFRNWITPRSNPEPRTRARVRTSRNDLDSPERPRSP